MGKSHSRPDSRRLRFERLELRRMLSITVDTLVDENNGVGIGAGTSLREAIAAAVPGDTIDFSVAGTINISLGALPTINKNLTVSGPGAGVLTIKAQDSTPTRKNGDGTRIFLITDGNTANLLDVSISGLTLTGGDVFSGGGAISTTENLVISDCVLTDNGSLFAGGAILSDAGPNVPPNSLTVRNCILTGNSTPSSEGGAIRKRFGTLTIEDTTIANNTANSAGGGVDAADGGVSVQINRSTISNNRTIQTTGSFESSSGYGGGIFVLSGTVSITASVINGNSSRQFGAGIFASASYLTLVDSVVSNNSLIASAGSGSGGFGAGISASSGGSIIRSTISGNSAGSGTGGGISGSVLSIVDCTISGNSAAFVGGVDIGGTSEIINSTISGNSASVSTGALVNEGGGTVKITSSTITANTSPVGSPGAVRGSVGKLQVWSSIIAGNTNGDVVGNPNRTPFLSLGYNLIGSVTGTSAFNQPGDQVGVADPMLGPLADNGGPTKTHMPLMGSPAIDTGDPSFNPADPDGNANTNDATPFDQRGAPYMRVFGERIDIGAIEWQFPSALIGDYNLDNHINAADYVTWRKAEGTTVSSPNSGSDGSGDSSIGMEDYYVWRAHFGQLLPIPESSASAAVAQVAARSASVTMEALAEPVAREGRVQAGVADSGDKDVREVAARVRRKPPAEPGAVELARHSALLTWLTVRGDVGEIDAAKDLTGRLSTLTEKCERFCDTLDEAWEVLGADVG